MDSPPADNLNKRQKKTHPFVDFNGVIYIDTSPSQAKPSDVIHNMDEETATLIDAQEELSFEGNNDDDFWSSGGENPTENEVSSLSASPLTLPSCRRVRLPEDVLLFPPNWSYDDSTASMPDFDDEDDDVSSVDVFEFVDGAHEEPKCDLLSQTKLVL
jgi:hypothetical protein